MTIPQPQPTLPSNSYLQSVPTVDSVCSDLVTATRERSEAVAWLLSHATKADIDRRTPCGAKVTTVEAKPAGSKEE